MFLETKRLFIRKFTLFDDFASLMADKDLMLFSLNGPMGREKAEEYLKKRILPHYDRYGYGLWALFHKEDQRIIGIAGLMQQVIDNEEQVELGYRLLPSYWGKGLATEANRAILDFAFQELGLKNIISIIDPANIRSLEAAKRIGMRHIKDTVFHGIPVKIFQIQEL